MNNRQPPTTTQPSKKSTFIPPLALHKRSQNGVPPGTVASRVRFLQSLGDTSTSPTRSPPVFPARPQQQAATIHPYLSINQRIGTLASRGVDTGRQANGGFSEAVEGLDRPLTDGIAIPTQKRAQDRTPGIHGRIVPLGLTARAQYDAVSPWGITSTIRRKGTRCDLNDNSIDHGRYVQDAGMPHQSTPISTTYRCYTSSQSDSTQRASCSTTSEKRKRSVRDLYRYYCIDRPHGLASPDEIGSAQSSSTRRYRVGGHCHACSWRSGRVHGNCANCGNPTGTPYSDTPECTECYNYRTHEHRIYCSHAGYAATTPLHDEKDVELRNYSSPLQSRFAKAASIYPPATEVQLPPIQSTARHKTRVWDSPFLIVDRILSGKPSFHSFGNGLGTTRQRGSACEGSASKCRQRDSESTSASVIRGPHRRTSIAGGGDRSYATGKHASGSIKSSETCYYHAEHWTSPAAMTPFRQTYPPVQRQQAPPANIEAVEHVPPSSRSKSRLENLQSAELGHNHSVTKLPRASICVHNLAIANEKAIHAHCHCCQCVEWHKSLCHGTLSLEKAQQLVEQARGQASEDLPDTGEQEKMESAFEGVAPDPEQAAGGSASRTWPRKPVISSTTVEMPYRAVKSRANYNKVGAGGGSNRLLLHDSFGTPRAFRLSKVPEKGLPQTNTSAAPAIKTLRNLSTKSRTRESTSIRHKLPSSTSNLPHFHTSEQPPPSPTPKATYSPSSVANRNIVYKPNNTSPYRVNKFSSPRNPPPSAQESSVQNSLPRMSTPPQNLALSMPDAAWTTRRVEGMWKVRDARLRRG